MAYVAVRGGTEAIEASIRLLSLRRLKEGRVLSADDARAGLGALIDQVMSEASFYSAEVAALAVKQAQGSPEEAVFLMRAFRSTLPRIHYTGVIDPANLRVERRISAAFKDIPGGQILGASTDYTHRLIDFSLGEELDADAEAWIRAWHEEFSAGHEKNGREPQAERVANDAAFAITDGLPEPGLPSVMPKVVDYLRAQDLLEKIGDDDTEPSDVTKKSLEFPTTRSERLQILTRGQTGALTAFGYAALRGYGALHPTVCELRVGMLELFVPDPFNADPEPEDSYYIGEVEVTEVESLIPVTVPLAEGRTELRFDLGYGICFGQNETKTIAMSLIDQCLETGNPRYPTQDEEFVLLHIDSVEATGFISHLKLPHYVTFQSKLEGVRATRQAAEAAKK